MGSSGTRFPERGLSVMVSGGLEREADWVSSSFHLSQGERSGLSQPVCGQKVPGTAPSVCGHGRALRLAGWEPMLAGRPGTLRLSTPCLALTLSWVLSTICKFHLEKVLGQKGSPTDMLTTFVGQLWPGTPRSNPPRQRPDCG